MDLDTRLRKVAVVGAAGKMGSGIALLLARELAWRSLENPGTPRALSLVDVSPSALQGLKGYLREQALKEGEKQINRLRRLYRDRPDLVENGEMIQAYADRLMALVDTGTSLELARGAHLVFEAAFEREDLKIGIYRELANAAGGDRPLTGSLCVPPSPPHVESGPSPNSASDAAGEDRPFFLTNTSSIPLHVLEEGAGIRGRLIGCHFYNPPAVQRLLEVVTPRACDPELEKLTFELAEVLGKTVVVAQDIAGFIGNGHFMRDGLQALRTAEGLSAELGLSGALQAVDALTRDWLLRPMGILQLIDYVGIDVFQLILRVMETHLQQGLHSPLVDRLLDQGVRGGQTSTGAPKDGFLKYERGRMVGVYDPERQAYVPLDPETTRAYLGPLPEPSLGWKGLQGDPRRDDQLRSWFQALEQSSARGAALALAHDTASRETALALVRDGVAASPEAVNRVLTLGFFHLYGPVHPFREGGRS